MASRVVPSLGQHPADDIVSRPELGCPEPPLRSGPWAGHRSPEADGHASWVAMRDIGLPAGLQHGDEFVPSSRVRPRRPAARMWMESGFLRALHRAVAGDHEQIAVLVIIPAVEHGGDPPPGSNWKMLFRWVPLAVRLASGI